MSNLWKVRTLAVLLGVSLLASADAALPLWEGWKAVQVGQSRQEVEAILGRPESVEAGANGEVLCYGIVIPESAAFPRAVGFYVHLQGDRVTLLEQPFEGEYSLEGAPTVPRLATPLNEQAFHHHPRFCDLRWWPSSGAQPVTYEVRVEAGMGRLKKAEEPRWFRLGTSRSAEFPHYALGFVGTQPGRWSVRAINAAGKSEWSAWRTFEWSSRQ